HVSDELIDAMASNEKIVPYIDIPLQHINDRILKRMVRRVDRTATEQIITHLRRGIPNLAIRTTFIVGFPGETDAEFEELLQFATAQRFERVGVFPYSLEPGTPAARLPDQLAEEVKLERRSRLMEAQQEIAFAWTRQQIDRE